MQHDIFISYSRQDFAAVSQIKDELVSLGLSCWMDLEGIESGSDEFTETIADAIGRSTIVLFFLSAASQGSRWSLNELRLARMEKKRIILVRFTDDRMTPRFLLEFGGSDAIDWRRPEQKAKLMRDLARWTNPAPANPPLPPREPPASPPPAISPPPTPGDVPSMAAREQPHPLVRKRFLVVLGFVAALTVASFWLVQEPPTRNPSGSSPAAPPLPTDSQRNPPTNPLSPKTDPHSEATFPDAKKTAPAETAQTPGRSANPPAYVNGVRVDGAAPGEWTHDWDAATAAAKRDGKPVFVNFTGSDWCGWCKILKRQVFATPDWGAWASNNVYLAHIDFPNDKELVPEKYRVRNRELSHRYKVTGYPTCYLLDPATLEPLGQFGASRDASPSNFIEKVSVAMPKTADAYEIVVPGSVKRLADGWFRSSEPSRIKVVRLSKGVERIGERAFNALPNLEKLVIPSTVTQIESGAFRWTFNLKEIVVDPSSPFKFENGFLLDKAETKLYFAIPRLEHAVIPRTVEAIEDLAFCTCRNLRSVEIPDGHPSLSADEHCLFGDSGKTVIKAFGSPTDIRIPDGVQRIAPEAFSHCETLRRAFVPDSVSDIGIWAFSSCRNLETLRLPSKADKCSPRIAEGCSNLRSLVLPEGVENLVFSYSGLRSVTELNIPKSVTSIGQEAIEGCDKLTEIAFPEGITTFDGYWCVSRCANLVKIWIPSTVVTINGGAVFGGNPKLEAIEISPDNHCFRSVDGVLFDKEMKRLIQCPGAKSGVYEIPSSVETINDFAFSRCKNLTEIQIPFSVKKIGYQAFLDCPAKTNRVAAATASAAIGLPAVERPVAWFSFDGNDGAGDRVSKDRSFRCRFGDKGPADRFVTNGVLKLNGVYATTRGDSNLVLVNIPELRNDMFSMDLSFYPEAERDGSDWFEGNSMMTILSFGESWRWFHVFLQKDGTGWLEFGCLTGGNLRIPLQTKIRLNEWNRLTVSFDIVRRSVRSVVNGQRNPDFALPDGFSFKKEVTARDSYHSLVLGHLGLGSVFRGELDNIRLYDRSFSNEELDALVIAR